MPLCNATKLELMTQGHSVLANCPVAGCGLPVVCHRDENAPMNQTARSPSWLERIFSWIFGVNDQPQITVPTPITLSPESAEWVKTLISNCLENSKQFEEESNTFAISSASIGKVLSYIGKMNFSVYTNDKHILIRGKTPRRSKGYCFDSFVWVDDKMEEHQTIEAIDHLQQQLTKFEMHKNFKLYDVHTDRQYLSFEDEKSGKISGGIDMVIAPKGLVTIGAISGACVAVELITRKDVVTKGFDSFKPQGILSLIASNYHSNQLTLVIVTDLVSGAYGWRFERINDVVGIVEYNYLSLAEMASLIVNHLETNCVPDKTFQLKRALKMPEFRDKEALQILSFFKKACVSESDLELEHFYELLELTEKGSTERAQVIQELFWSQGLPSSNYLHAAINAKVDKNN